MQHLYCTYTLCIVPHLDVRHAATNARHQAEKRRLQTTMAPANKDSVPPARTSTPGMLLPSALAALACHAD